MPRCCQPLDLTPCYASVLVAGSAGLEPALRVIEDGRLCPCVTAWCPRCRRVALVTAGAGASFPSPSAYAAHLLALHARVEATLLSQESRL